MSVQALIETEGLDLDMQIALLKESSLLYLGLHSRQEYYEKFVKRLEFIPQLFLDSVARNRLIHVQNGLAILESLKVLGLLESCNIYEKEFSQLKNSFLLHDIGHPQYGHAGERAINEFLNNYNLFFHNSSFSAELQTRHRKNGTDLASVIGNNIFRLKPLENEVECKVIIDKLVDFIDDLENAVGDLTDLIKILKDSSSEKLYNKYFNTDENVITNAVLLVKRYIKDSFQFHDFLFDENHELKRVIREIRSYVRQVVKNDEQLASADMIWFEKTTEDIRIVFDLLTGMYNTRSEKEIAEVTAKIVALKAL